eukprot:CAMPEP_0171365714 /NCGR_PEP_ID=MMETSP0879-20121228/4893_1 /TAXON_ID=67004 /ORGANISM="Thalassiosira weissflogii, Strain CCMP1336" /LENGTH=57 /DNA_ID=CAMNT_0011873369 /DNA_START=1227 /DNA_END=1400 /DNA_ORIENTATION=+
MIKRKGKTMQNDNPHNLEETNFEASELKGVRAEFEHKSIEAGKQQLKNLHDSPRQLD